MKKQAEDIPREEFVPSFFYLCQSDSKFTKLHETFTVKLLLIFSRSSKKYIEKKTKKNNSIPNA